MCSQTAPCPLCMTAAELAIQETRRRDLHMVTCHDSACRLNGYTLCQESYLTMNWLPYVKGDAEAVERIQRNVAIILGTEATPV